MKTKLGFLLLVIVLSCNSANRTKNLSHSLPEQVIDRERIAKEGDSSIEYSDLSVIDNDADTQNAKISNLDRPDSTQIQNLNVDQKDKTLRNAYTDFFPVGTAIEPGLFRNPLKAKFITDQYSSVTATNQMKPLYLQAKEGVFTWDEADKIIEFAQKNNMKVRGHCLVWSQRMPEWLYLDGQKDASKELVLKRIKNHIEEVLAHFEGQVYCWDVVNEAVNFFQPNPIDPRPDKLYDLLGEEYIEKAFQYARNADPTVKLFYNDNGFENPKKRDKVYSFLKKMKDKGVPIDGVGLQGHWGIEGMSEEYLQETIDMFYGIGLELQITELDISIYPKRVGRIGTGRILRTADLVGTNESFTREIQIEQAETFERIFRVFRENKGKVTGITLWSPWDRNNYLTKKLGKKNYPYLFNEDLTPKEAFYKVVNF